MRRRDLTLLTRHTGGLSHPILADLGPAGQVEAAREDPVGPAANSAILGSIPALKASTLAKMRGVASASPPAPPSPEHRQPVQEGLERGRKSQHLSAVAGQECPRQGARPSLLGPAGQTEGSKGRGAVPSQLARETMRGASPGPSSGTWRRGAGRPGGHKAVPCELRFTPSAFSGGTPPLAANPKAPLSPVPLELSTRCHHLQHRHAMPILSAPTPEFPLCIRPPRLCWEATA